MGVSFKNEVANHLQMAGRYVLKALQVRELHGRLRQTCQRAACFDRAHPADRADSLGAHRNVLDIPKEGPMKKHAWLALAVSLALFGWLTPDAHGEYPLDDGHADLPPQWNSGSTFFRLSMCAYAAGD